MNDHGSTVDPMMFNWMPERAAKAPQRAALHFEGSDITYADFAARIEKLACGLHRTGLVEGDRLAFMGLNTPDVLALLFACARLGTIFVPLNWRLTPSEIVQLLANAEPKAVVADPEFTQILETSGAPSLRLTMGDPIAGWSELPFVAGRAPLPADHDRPVLICYTSGTTGTPRGAVLTQAAIRACVLNALDAYNLGESDNILNALPLFHVGGLNIQCLPALAVGATVTLHRRFDPGLVLRDIEARRITQIIAVPAMVAALLEHPSWKTTDLSSLRCLTTGSSTVPPALIEAISARGVPVGQVYGTTETGPTAIVLRAADAPDKPGSCGTPALLSEIRLIDDAGADAAEGATGEILVRGPNVMSGYWNDPAATAEVMHEGWFRTGDVAVRDRDGFYFVRDRRKNIIISGGENIYPAELEAVLAACPDIAEAVVVGRSDPRWVEVPVAYVVTRHPMTQRQVRALFEGKLARFKHPRDIVFLDALPRNAMGKVQKFKLKDAQAAAVKETGKSFDDHAAEKEQILAYVLKKGAVAVGVADVAMIDRFAPKGFRPRDLLPKANSVIVFGMTGPTAGTWAASAKLMAYNGGNVGPIYRIASGLSYFIEGKFGYRSIMCPAHVDPEAGSRIPMQSMKLQAELAGIGARSMAGDILLHPEYGMLYYASVITELPLPADQPMADNPCPAPSCATMWRSTGRTPCQKFCPVDALSGSIDDGGQVQEMIFDMHACAQMCQQYEIMPNLLARAMAATDPLEREYVLFGPEAQGYFYKVTTGIGATNGQCFECMRVCPVVAKAPQGDPIRRGGRNH